MDEIELTKLFVEYSENRKKQSILEAQIKAAVLELGETRKIAGITASYYKESMETPDYEAAAREAMPDGFDTQPFSTTFVSVSWKSVCEALGVQGHPGALKPARVVIK